MQGILIREADRGDEDDTVRLVIALLSELGGIPPPEKNMRHALRQLLSSPDKGFILLSESDTRPVAICTVSHVVALRSQGQYSIIQEMYVEPGYRDAEIGSSLLLQSLKESISRGSRFVEVGTPLEGSRQLNFYRRFGFVSVGQRLRWSP